MSAAEKDLYERLKTAGHSPAKAAEIVIDVRRGDCFAIQWIAILGIRIETLSTDKPKFKWSKTDSGWTTSKGILVALVRTPATPPLFYYHWSVRSPTRSGGSGSTSSLAASKRAAETELNRFENLLAEPTT